MLVPDCLSSVVKIKYLCRATNLLLLVCFPKVLAWKTFADNLSPGRELWRTGGV